MDLLFIVPYTPNLIRVRPYHLIRALVCRGHRVSLATLWTSAGERADLDRLADQGVRVLACRLSPARSVLNCLRALPGRAPLQAAYCWQPTLARQVQAALRQSHFDIVHVEHLRGAWYGLRAARLLTAEGQPEAALRRARPAVVWDSVDCLSHLFQQAARVSCSHKSRLMARVELGRTRHYEAWLARQFDRVLVSSQVDCQALRSLSRHPLRINVLPNGVDLDYFTPAEQARESATLVITGKMSYHANVTGAVHLVRDILRRVWARRPDVHVWIVGKDPAAEIRALERPARGRSANGGRVTVVGTVSDIRPYLCRATLAVAPLPYGAGIQNKVLEAMACATPVVASSRAVSALAVRPGRDLIVAEGAETFAQAVLRLLDAPDRRVQVGRAGRAYVEAHHAWPAVAARLEAIYRSAWDPVSGQTGERG